MKEKILILLIFFYCDTIAKAQINTELIAYYHIEDSARYCENNQRYDEAIYYYKKLLVFKQFEITNLNYESLFQVYLKQNNVDSAKYYLTQFILHAGPIERDWFKYQTNDTINLNIDSLNNLYRFNYAIYNKIYKIFNDDQALRRTITILSKSSTKYNSSIRESIFTTCDSANFIELKQAIESLGHLPTMKEIGWRLQNLLSMVLMLHHLKKDPAFWELLYKTAISNGIVTRRTFPFVNDYYHYGDMQDLKDTNNISYRFCEYINYRKDPKQILEPTYPKEVDKLRAEFYLPPLYMKAIIEGLKLPKNYDEK